MTPPYDLSLEVLFLIRQQRGDTVLMYLPNGDSYTMSPEDVSRYISRICDGFGDDALTYVWNFYTVAVDLVNRRLYWLTKEDLLTAVRREAEKRKLAESLLEV